MQTDRRAEPEAQARRSSWTSRLTERVRVSPYYIGLDAVSWVALGLSYARVAPLVTRLTHPGEAPAAPAESVPAEAAGPAAPEAAALGTIGLGLITTAVLLIRRAGQASAGT